MGSNKPLYTTTNPHVTMVHVPSARGRSELYAWGRPPRHVCAASWRCLLTYLLTPVGTLSRGRSRRSRRKPNCTSRRRWAADAGSAGRSRRSRCRRCSLRTRNVLGAGAAVAEGVGGVETRPLARPPKGTQKKSLDAAVA